MIKSCASCRRKMFFPDRSIGDAAWASLCDDCWPIVAVPYGSPVGAECVVCAEPASFVVLGSWRCVSHKETTVVGPPPASAPVTTVTVTVPVPAPASAPVAKNCYYDCIEGHHVCGKEAK